MCLFFARTQGIEPMSKLEFFTPKALPKLAQGITLGLIRFIHPYAESVE